MQRHGIAILPFHAFQYSFCSNSFSKSPILCNREISLPPRQLPLKLFTNRKTIQCCGTTNRAGITDKNIFQTRISHYECRIPTRSQHSRDLSHDTIHIMRIPSHHSLVTRWQILNTSHRRYYLINISLMGVGTSFGTNTTRANHPESRQLMTQPYCPSSKQMGLLSVFHKGGSGSSLFDVKPLGVDGSSGGFGWSVF